MGTLKRTVVERLPLCSSRKTYLGRIRSKTLCEVRKVSMCACECASQLRAGDNWFVPLILSMAVPPTSLQVDNRLGMAVGTQLWKVTADESALGSRE